MGITRIRRPPKTTASFRRQALGMGVDQLAHTCIPYGQAPRFPHGWLNTFGHPDTPIMIGWVDYRL